MRFKNTNRENFPLPISGVLADICISSSSSISQDSIEKDFGEFPIYGANGEIKKISKYEKESSYIAIVKDGAGVGRVIIANPFSSVIGTLNYIENKPNCNLLYLYYLLQKLDFTKYVVGSGIPHIYFKDYKNVEIKIPTLKEQEKIGEFLGSFDKIIQKQQEKIGLLKEFKKGHLQQMFPSKDSNVPKIRFKKFTDAWEQRELSELATFRKGSGYSKGDLVDNGSPIILYGRLYTKYETTISDVDTYVLQKSGSVISAGGEVIVPASGETAEDIAIASVVEKPGIILGGDLNVIHPKEIIESTFLALSITYGFPHIDMAKRAQGKSVVHLHNSDLKKVILSFPKKEEQLKISQYLIKLDSLITLHQRKLKSLEDLKKGYMQRLYAL